MPAEALRFSQPELVPAGPGAVPRAPLGPELEQALQSMSAERHADTARRITDLFVAGANQFNPQHVGLFDRTLGHLIGVLPADVLASVAQRLAPVRNAPPDVMRRLAANPAIAVAGPVLARSNLLDDDALVTIASSGSQAHLFAISGRPRLGTAVTDVLVDCGDRDVVRNLAMNGGADLSAAGLAMLLARAVSDGVLAEKLAQRPDVPPQGLRSLARAASDVARRRLLDAVPPEVKSELAAIEAAPDAAEAASHVEAWRVARALKRTGKLSETQVLVFARTGRIKETMAALALICDLPVEVVRRLMSQEPDAALILCQAAGFSPAIARMIVEAGHRGAPGIADTLTRLNGLSSKTAQGVVGFWRAYQRAA